MSEMSLCKECTKILEEYEEHMDDIRNDPIANYGGVVGDLLEDAEIRFAREVREKMCLECAGIILGDIATRRYERKVYREPY